MRMTALVLGLALICQPLQAQEPQPFRTVGELAPEYAFNLACAEELGAPHSAFTNFKAQVSRDFGTANAAKVQSYYNQARQLINGTKPSLRPRIAQRMNCLDNAANLAAQIRDAWRDGIWLARR